MFDHPQSPIILLDSSWCSQAPTLEPLIASQVKLFLRCSSVWVQQTEVSFSFLGRDDFNDDLP